MKYALIYSFDPATAAPTAGEISDWMAFDADVRGTGAFIHEAGFHSADDGVRVSVRDGAANTSQIAAAGDVVAGYYVVEVADSDAAVALARRIPTANYGHVDVRQVVEYGG